MGRFHLIPSELALLRRALKESRDGADTMSAESAFHSGIVRHVKKFLSSLVLCALVLYLYGWFERILESDLVKLMSSADTATCPCTTLNSNASRTSRRLSSKFLHPRGRNISVTLLVLL